MTNSIGESISRAPSPYPQVWEGLDRIQIRMDEKRFIVLIRHPVHGFWNGYVMVPRSVWEAIHWDPRSFVPFVCDYEGPGSNHIGWVDMSRGGTTMLKLSPPGETDLWVGFSTFAMPLKEYQKIGQAREMAEILESKIWEARVANSLT